eukprot:2542835-Rhodomonas_salina.3
MIQLRGRWVNHSARGQQIHLFSEGGSRVDDSGRWKQSRCFGEGEASESMIQGGGSRRWGIGGVRRHTQGVLREVYKEHDQHLQRRIEYGVQVTGPLAPTPFTHLLQIDS